LIDVTLLEFFDHLAFRFGFALMKNVPRQIVAMPDQIAASLLHGSERPHMHRTSKIVAPHSAAGSATED
jgi:hypothetical protein